MITLNVDAPPAAVWELKFKFQKNSKNRKFLDLNEKSFILQNTDFFQNNEPRGLKLEEQWFLVPQVSRKFIVTSFRKLDFSAKCGNSKLRHFFMNAQFSKNACSFRLCALYSCILHDLSFPNHYGFMWFRENAAKLQQVQNHHFVILSSQTAEHACIHTLHVYIAGNICAYYIIRQHTYIYYIIYVYVNNKTYDLAKRSMIDGTAL